MMDNELKGGSSSLDDREENERLRIRNELAEMSFAELQALKEKIGTKMYNKTLFEEDDSKIQFFQRENKNRPRELTSKKTVSRFREVVAVKKKVMRDPRFDDLSGTFSERIFQHSYSFLDDIKKKEKEELKGELKAENDEKRKDNIKYLIQRMDNQQREEKRKKEKAEKKASQRKEIIKQVKEGQKPYFIKKSEEKKIELVEKFEELKTSKKLDKYLVRKRKKNVKKEWKAKI